MDTLKHVLLELGNRGVIINKGSEVIESYYIVEEQTTIEKTDEEVQLEKNVENTALETFIDETFYDILVSKIKAEVKSAVNNELFNPVVIK